MQRKLFVLLLTGFVICELSSVNAGLCDRNREDVGNDFLYLECGRGKRENNIPEGLKATLSPSSSSVGSTPGSPKVASPKATSPKAAGSPALEKSASGSSKLAAAAGKTSKGRAMGSIVAQRVQEVESRIKNNVNPLLVPVPVDPPSMKMQLDRPKPKHFDVPRVPDSTGRIK